jgi:hypothetical protein
MTCSTCRAGCYRLEVVAVTCRSAERLLQGGSLGTTTGSPGDRLVQLDGSTMLCSIDKRHLLSQKWVVMTVWRWFWFRFPCGTLQEV